MKYICEICNTKFDSPAEAERCELTHKEQRQRIAKEAAEIKISNAVNAFISKYGEMPTIHLSDENEAITLTEISADICEMLESFFSALCGGEEDAPHEDCKQCGGSHCKCDE
jgi:hypothetical protein